MKGSTALRRCAGIADPNIRRRVRRGVKLLNRKLGNDWPNEINLDEFDFADPSYCVIGQLATGDKYYDSYHGYNNMLGKLGVLHESEDYGFDWEYDEGSRKLSDAWLLVLGGR